MDSSKALKELNEGNTEQAKALALIGICDMLDRIDSTLSEMLNHLSGIRVALKDD